MLALNGAFKHDPKRAEERKDEPQGVPVDLESMPVPSTLSELEAVVWDELVPRMHRGVVLDVDLHAFAITVRLITRALYDEEIDPKVTAQLKAYLGLFGMTPADRSRVKVAPGTKQKTPFDEFDD